MIASKADIIARESLGYSHLVYREESYFVNLDSENSRLKFKEYLENETSRAWGIVELGRYVFYRKDMYVLGRSNLRLNNAFQGKVEIPINAISCECMFSYRNLEGIDFSDFDTSGIENIDNMFDRCVFPKGFSLGNKFDTSSVKSMEAMFYGCAFPDGFSLGDKFDTSSVRVMSYMFDSCSFSDGFSLGDRFDTSMVENMHNMFYNCKFSKGFSLGDRFDTSSVKDMSDMFSSTKFNEDFSLSKDFTIGEKSEDMFYDAKLPSRVAKQLGSRTTDEEIVELLKSDLAGTVIKADFF